MEMEAPLELFESVQQLRRTDLKEEKNMKKKISVFIQSANIFNFLLTTFKPKIVMTFGKDTLIYFHKMLDYKKNKVASHQITTVLGEGWNEYNHIVQINEHISIKMEHIFTLTYFPTLSFHSKPWDFMVECKKHYPQL